MKVIITGFDPFGGESINPAFEAIKKLKDSILGYDIVKLEIPTVFGKSIQVLEAAIKDHQPDIVICIGQAGGRFAITPEYVAINLEMARIEDNEGNKPSEQAVVDGGDKAYFSKLPVNSIVKSLTDHGIPSTISFSAGTYVCNHLFYGLLHTIEKNHPTIQGGFIHVPFLPEQVLDKRDTPFMSLEMITEALNLSIEACIENKSDIEMAQGTEH